MINKKAQGLTMQTLRSTVYIPLVELTDQPNQLLEIYCENQSFGQSELDTKSLDKDWHYIAAELRRVGLYEDGLQAINSVRKLGLKIPFWAVYQKYKKYSWLDNQRLHSVNVLDCEGESAQLGLAIALLTNASQSPIHHVIATGKLSKDTFKNQHHNHDVAIESVGGIQQKLQLLIEKRRSNTLLSDEDLYCFTPYYYQQDDKDLPVIKLPEVKELEKLNVHVKPVRWLSDVAKLLKADTSRHLSQDKWLATGVFFFSALILAGCLYFGWWHYPIQIQMLAGKNNAEPFLVCTNQDDSDVSYFDLKRDGGIPIFPVFSKKNSDYNTGLAWRMIVEKTLFSQHYYTAFIHLGEKTRLKIINHYPETGKEIKLVANEPFEWYWGMQEDAAQNQDNILLLAIQRTPIDVDAINRGFLKRFSSDSPVNILAARDFLIDQLPNNYTFSYQSILSNSLCLKN
ncbi:MAG: hypothetical protein V3U87_01385 [Methylococcaceae bacterium]